MSTKIVGSPTNRVFGDQLLVLRGIPLRDGALVGDRPLVGGLLRRAIRDARTIVAEYARAGGMRDPERVAAFARSCVASALQQMGPSPAPTALSGEAVKIAVERFGLGDSRQANDSRRIAAQKKRVVQEGRGGSLVVPPSMPLSMPPQPLGALPPLVQPKTWRRLAGGALGFCTGFAARLRSGY